MEELGRIDEDVLVLFIPVIAIIGGTILGLVAMILGHFRKMRREEIEASLKAQMIERGMGVEEIHRVLALRGEKCDD